MLRRFQFDILNYIVWNKKNKRKYRFYKGVWHIVDRKRPRLKKFKWWHGHRFGRSVSKIHLHNTNLWYHQKKGVLLKNLLILKNKQINTTNFNSKFLLNNFYELEE